MLDQGLSWAQPQGSLITMGPCWHAMPHCQQAGAGRALVPAVSSAQHPKHPEKWTPAPSQPGGVSQLAFTPLHGLLFSSRKALAPLLSMPCRATFTSLAWKCSLCLWTALAQVRRSPRSSEEHCWANEGEQKLSLARGRAMASRQGALAGEKYRG